MPDPNNYTVGWVSALTTEYVAAQVFLDEKHECPDGLSANDTNEYTLGRIGKHNVVIGVVSGGEYGISTAAGVARNMMHSFPNIRIVLMVGIGGGAPSQKHDIRLGDVVVGARRDGYGGVFQYDFGKTVQNQDFRHIGPLNQPSDLLRTAVADIKAEHGITGHQLDEAISSILAQNPQLRNAYGRPTPSSDRLINSTIIHGDESASCETGCIDDLIARRNRTEDENPAIHYGTIASASQLMVNALARDKLAEEEDVLCFEMEASGLISHFPCLAIRGICDYSDSHKSQEWHGYAAMAAAAYAKDLLIRIPPNKVEAERRIGDILSVDSEVQEGVAGISPHHSEQHQAILDWLSPVDFGLQQSDYLKKRQPQTGQWFLDSQEFQTWLHASNQVLFCQGIPGAGKTILTAITIEYITRRFTNKANIGIAYLYCSYQRRHEQKVEDLLANLLKQLSKNQSSLPDIVNNLYSQHKSHLIRPSLDEIMKAFLAVAALYSKVFIIIDALDEYQEFDGSRSILLAKIFKLQAKSGANIFATSRSIPDIVEKFQGSMSLEIRATEKDVRSYLDGSMLRLPGFVIRDPELEEEIKIKITQLVDGMFLLAQLHLDSLVGKRSPQEIRTTLKNLPKGSQAYEHAYEGAMRRIDGQAQERKILAKQVLSWISCAKRPLTTSEIRHALAIEPDDSELQAEKLPNTGDMVSACAGLVAVDEESGIIRLVHYTTQLFFEKRHGGWLLNAETYVSTTCLTYLLFDAFESGFCSTDQSFEDRLRRYPLYDYAARNWGYHARAASKSVEKMVLNFVGAGAKTRASIQAMLVSVGGSGYSQNVPQGVTEVHLAAFFGLTGAIPTVLSNVQDPDAKDTYGRTPLSYAAEKGHDVAVKLLLEANEVDPDSRSTHWSCKGRTPLSWAAGNGHEAVVKHLLTKNGVFADSKSSNGQTPLSWAAGNGHEGVVQLLLANECVNPDLKSNSGRTPLRFAVEKGHEAVVELLLANHHVDPDSKDSSGQTPLSQAAGKGNEIMVRLLFTKYGININSKDNNGRTPLRWAAGNGQEAIVELLLAKEDIDPDTESLLPDPYDPESTYTYKGRTPLSWAAGKGHENVVRLLLAREDVDPDSKGFFEQTPLSYAAQNGHKAIVRLLLANKGVDPDSRSNKGRTPLSLAAEKGHEEVVELLLTKDSVDINSKDENGRTPLSWAAEKGHKAVVQLLLIKESIMVNLMDESGRAPLSWAVERGHEVVVQLLLVKEDVDPDSKDRYERTPLSYAADKGHQAIVKLLLSNKDTYAVSRSNTGRTPLSWAAEMGHEAVVQLLLSKDGVNLNSKDDNGRTPLSWAAEKGHERVAELLLTKNGVDVNLTDNNGRAPLSWAAETGHKVLAELLLMKNGIDVNSVDDNGRTALSWVAEKGHEAVVKLLLMKNDVKVNSTDNSGRTSLSWAAEKGAPVIIKLLLTNESVDVNLADKDGRTPLSWAAENGHDAVVKLLLTKEEIDVNVTDKNKRTPLSWAAEKGHEAVMQLLATEDLDMKPKRSWVVRTICWAQRNKGNK